MVQALVRLDDDTNRVLNIVKARQGLRNKGEAIEYVVREFVELEGEPELKPEFIEKMRAAGKQEGIRVDDFAKRYGLK